MKDKFLKAIMVEPLQQPKIVYIPNELKYLKQLVNPEPSLTESADLLVLEGGVCILRNKDGALLDLKGNRKILSSF